MSTSTASLLAALEADLSASGVVISADDVTILPAPKPRLTAPAKAPKAPKAPKVLPGYPNGIAAGKAYCTCCGYAKREDRVTNGTCKTCVKALTGIADLGSIRVVGRVTKGNVPVVVTYSGNRISVSRVAVL